MNKRTIALTTEQYKEIIQTMREGFCGCRPNERIATALVLEGNLGLRISDILSLRLSDIVRDGDRYRLEITEQKTKKKRVFTVPLVIQQYIENYCLKNGIEKTESDYSGTLRATCPDFESHHSGEWEPYIPVIQSHLIGLYYIYFLYTVNTHLWCEYR